MCLGRAYWQDTLSRKHFVSGQDDTGRVGNPELETQIFATAQQSLIRHVGCGHGTRATELESDVRSGYLSNCSAHHPGKGRTEIKVDIPTLQPQ